MDRLDRQPRADARHAGAARASAARSGPGCAARRRGDGDARVGPGHGRAARRDHPQRRRRRRPDRVRPRRPDAVAEAIRHLASRDPRAARGDGGQHLRGRQGRARGRRAVARPDTGRHRHRRVGVPCPRPGGTVRARHIAARRDRPHRRGSGRARPRRRLVGRPLDLRAHQRRGHRDHLAQRRDRASGHHLAVGGTGSASPGRDAVEPPLEPRRRRGGPCARHGGGRRLRRGPTNRGVQPAVLACPGRALPPRGHEARRRIAARRAAAGVSRRLPLVHPRDRAGGRAWGSSPLPRSPS